VLRHDDHQLSMDAIDVYLISIRRQHENDMQLFFTQRYLWKLLRQAIHISRRDVINATSADEHYTTTIAFTKT
jgi:hypothetical protein